MHGYSLDRTEEQPKFIPIYDHSLTVTTYTPWFWLLPTSTILKNAQSWPKDYTDYRLSPASCMHLVFAWKKRT